MKFPAQITAFTIEGFLKHLLTLDPQTPEHLKPLIGKRLQVIVTDFELQLVFQVTDKNIKVFANGAENHDVSIKGSAINLIRLGLAKNIQSYLTQSNVSIHGDLITLQRFQEIMQTIDFDWEGKLGSIIGEGPAAAVSEASKTMKSGTDIAKESFPSFVQYHLQNTLKTFPKRQNIEKFYDEIDILRESIDRLKAKVAAIGQESKNV